MRTVMVPGLRGAAPDHWQERLVTSTDVVHLRTDRAPLDLRARVADLDEAVAGADEVAIVAHSAGVLTLLHWAAGAGSLTAGVAGALLVTPPMLHTELPDAYPRLAELERAGWLPVPAGPLPFATTVIVSQDDPLGPVDAVVQAAKGWSARVVDAGAVGHANPASGHGDWPFVTDQVAALTAGR